MNTIAMSHTTDPTKQSHTADAIRSFREGGVVVLPTDTVYGIVASALHPAAVERVLQLRQRDLHKAVIVLISDIQELTQFSVHPDESARAFLKSVWPGKVSVVLPTADPARWVHVHRGTGSIAFRIPSDEPLRDLLRHTGPLIAPSANIAGEPAATSIEEARQYFGDRVDLYIDGGRHDGPPSTLVRWTSKGIEILRQGAVTLDIPNA